MKLSSILYQIYFKIEINSFYSCLSRSSRDEALKFALWRLKLRRGGIFSAESTTGANWKIHNWLRKFFNRKLQFLKFRRIIFRLLLDMSQTFTINATAKKDTVAMATGIFWKRSYFIIQIRTLWRSSFSKYLKLWEK